MHFPHHDIVNSLWTPLGLQKSLNSREVYSSPLLKCKALSFMPISNSIEAIHFWKVGFISRFAWLDNFPSGTINEGGEVQCIIQRSSGHRTTYIVRTRSNDRVDESMWENFHAISWHMTHGPNDHAIGCFVTTKRCSFWYHRLFERSYGMHFPW